MVPRDSHGIPRVPWYSGVQPGVDSVFTYEAFTLYRRPSHAVRLTRRFVTPWPVRNRAGPDPTTPPWQNSRAWHHSGLGCFPFARRYLGNRFCFLFLGVLRCFSSPRSPLLPMYSVIDIPELPGMGFPIRKSPAQCLFNGSPKLIAVSHVFHRHPTPRHPPSALNSLAINFSHLCYWVYYLRHLWNCITLYSVFKEQTSNSC